MSRRNTAPRHGPTAPVHRHTASPNRHAARSRGIHSRLVAAAACALALLGAGVPSAWAAPTNPPSVGLAWDGPTTNLDWRGHGYATADGTFIGSVVAVPGDHAERTAIIRNDGPGSARARVEITMVTSDAADTVNDELAAIVKLRWDVDGHTGSSTWKDAPVGAPVYSTTFSVAKDAEFPVTAGYLFPFEATGGKNAGHTSSELRFDVRVVLEGEISPPKQVHTGGQVVAPPDGLAAAAVLGLTAVAILILRRVQPARPARGRANPQRKELP